MYIDIANACFLDVIHQLVLKTCTFIIGEYLSIIRVIANLQAIQGLINTITLQLLTTAQSAAF